MPKNTTEVLPNDLLQFPWNHVKMPNLRENVFTWLFSVVTYSITLKSLLPGQTFDNWCRVTRRTWGNFCCNKNGGNMPSICASIMFCLFSACCHWAKRDVHPRQITSLLQASHRDRQSFIPIFTTMANLKLLLNLTSMSLDRGRAWACRICRCTTVPPLHLLITG